MTFDTSRDPKENAVAKCCSQGESQGVSDFNTHSSSKACRLRNYVCLASSKRAHGQQSMHTLRPSRVVSQVSRIFPRVRMRVWLVGGAPGEGRVWCLSGM